ncbi:geranylgeranylglycerol-phosphate geranylgeranyltransferase [Flavobacterium agricola]|uniref:Geranylgeranylglycerol-phosphate geranylgeranyltransferase n=1 Tax=Flavobacterium agricola TaxID=2870839 RepID=A0ABY6M2E3_9FLAO|nr:geranylgeranylglycerol-phosphate geranylgeranyltransferase [Flavobacterium agricola]UYW01296.1 geranylgeranylglycerol-phosphate geranylgeranyltransferase [Flavobacterium agricola]
MTERKLKYFFIKFISLFSVVRGYNIFVIVIAQYLASIFIFAENETILEVLLDANLFLIVFSSTLAIAGGYIINNFYDSEKDLINRPHKLMLDKLVSQEFKLRVYFSLNFFAVVFSFIVSWHAAAFFAGYIFLLWFYSHKLKKYPFIGNLTASLVAVLPFFSILMYFQNFHSVIFVHAALVYLFVLIRELIKDLTSIKGDLANNYRTISVVYGESFAKHCISFLSVLVLIPCWLLMNKYDVGYMNYFLYFALFILLLINIMLYKTDATFGYKKIHVLMKILILIGIFSILLIDAQVIHYGKRLLLP